MDIQRTGSGYPAVRVSNNHTATTDADVLYATSTNGSAGSGSWNLRASCYKGRTGYYSKYTDDNQYCMYISAASSSSEGLYVYGTSARTGHEFHSIGTSRGYEPIFSVESVRPEIYASGSAQLVDGKAIVSFDRLFTEATSRNEEIRVTVTPSGGWSALYIESRSASGFVVRSASGDQSIEFDWMACGLSKDHAERDTITIPDPLENQRLTEEKELALGLR